MRLSTSSSKPIRSNRICLSPIQSRSTTRHSTTVTTHVVNGLPVYAFSDVISVGSSSRIARGRMTSRHVTWPELRTGTAKMSVFALPERRRRNARGYFPATRGSRPCCCCYPFDRRGRQESARQWTGLPGQHQRPSTAYSMYTICIYAQSIGNKVRTTRFELL